MNDLWYFNIGLGPPIGELCVREIELTQGFKALVSAEDYSKVRAYEWQVCWKGYTGYAQRGMFKTEEKAREAVKKAKEKLTPW